MKSIIAILMLFAAVACLNKTKHEETPSSPPPMEKTDMSGPEYTSRYICPMFCKGSGSDTVGVCPVCGMDYELNPDFKTQ